MNKREEEEERFQKVTKLTKHSDFISHSNRTLSLLLISLKRFMFSFSSVPHDTLNQIIFLFFFFYFSGRLFFKPSVELFGSLVTPIGLKRLSLGWTDGHIGRLKSSMCISKD